MAFCNIDDVDILILSWIIDFKLYIDLSILNKHSYQLITNTLIYKELTKIKNYDIKLNDDNIIDTYYRLGLINILKKLRGHNKRVDSKKSILFASAYGHVNILEWYKNLNLGFKFSYSEIKLASLRGHVEVLEW